MFWLNDSLKLERHFDKNAAVNAESWIMSLNSAEKFQNWKNGGLKEIWTFEKSEKVAVMQQNLAESCRRVYSWAFEPEVN